MRFQVVLIGNLILTQMVGTFLFSKVVDILKFKLRIFKFKFNSFAPKGVQLIGVLGCKLLSRS